MDKYSLNEETLPGVETQRQIRAGAMRATSLVAMNIEARKKVQTLHKCEIENG